MLGKPLPYILNLRNIDREDFELVGKEALDNARILEEHINNPDAFILTTKAFDDFLTASNLIEPITESLARVKPFSKILSKRASEEISELILNSNFPNIIKRPIQEAYRNLGNHEQPFVFIEPSNIIDSDFIPDTSERFTENNVRGIDDLLYKVKTSWLSLFTPEAIELRVDQSYMGILSVAVIIRKMVRAEIAGRGYTVPPLTQETNLFEIHANFGFEEINNQEVQSDIYKVDKSSLKIMEKNIVEQDSMLVRKSNAAPGEVSTMRIEISKQWRRAQKINDKMIIELAKSLKKLESLYKEPIEVFWGLELGEFSIQNIKVIKGQAKKKKVRVNLTHYQPQFIAEVSSQIEPEFRNVNDVELDKLVDEVQDFKKPVVEISTGKINSIEKQEEKFTEITYEKTYKFFTKPILDISKLNPETLSAINYYQGGFLDGTEIILTNNALPEEYVKSEKNLAELINIFNTNITTAANAAGKNNLIYKFSDINHLELKLLGIEDTKYPHYGDLRFVNVPESLSVEVLALKKARNQMNYKNINICIPALRSYENLIKIKKTISAEGLRRSSSLKFYAEVSLPSFIFELKRLDNSDIDGIVINYEKLLLNSVNKNTILESDHQIGIQQIKSIKELIPKDLEIYVEIGSAEFTEKFLAQLIPLKLEGIIFRNQPDDQLFRSMEDIEHQYAEKLRPERRRPGRKIKKLF